MAFLAELPDGCSDLGHVLEALSSQETTDGFHRRLSLFTRIASRSDNESSLTVEKLEKIVDSLRGHLHFPIRPALPRPLLPDVFCNEDEAFIGSSGRAYEWKWWLLDIEWKMQSESERRPIFPMPIAILRGSAIEGFVHLLSLTALWHLSESLLAGSHFPGKPLNSFQ